MSPTPFASGTLVVLRHAERVDYTTRDRGENWTSSAASPWDSPITEFGVSQALGAGVRISQLLEGYGREGVTRIYTSPHVRCGETATRAAEAMNDRSAEAIDQPTKLSSLQEIKIEHGLVESMSEDWYRSWASPGADSTWGGPKHCRKGVEVKAGGWNALAYRGAGGLFNDPASMQASKNVVLPVTGEGYVYKRGELDQYTVENMEPREEERKRVKRTCVELVKKHPGETVLVCSHGSPCTHIWEELMNEKYSGKTFGYSCISVYKWVEGEDGGVEWDCLCVNDLEHTDVHGDTIHCAPVEEKAKL